MLNKKNIRRIYELCITGSTAKKICEVTGRDKAQVSRIIKSLIDAGFLICINPKDKVLFYEATKKKLTDKAISTVDNYQHEGRISTNERGLFVRVHAIRFISTVEKMGKVPWDKKWTASEVDHYFYQYPFLNVGKIGFEWVVGNKKKKSKFIIHLPSIRWNPKNGNPELFLRNTADVAGTWFMKRFRCDFRGIHQCGKGHFEMPVHDKDLVKMAQATSVRVGDFILDCSLGYPEFGSVGGYDVLEELLSLPKRVAKLEEQMVWVIGAIGVIQKTLDKVVVSMQDVQKALDELNALLRKPSKPDDYLDVT